MSSDQQKSGTRWFIVRQTALLMTTIVLAFFFTVPLIKAAKAALNPAELEADLGRAKQDEAGLDRKVMVAQAKITMGAGDDETQEKLRKEVEELKRQVAAKETENKNLQEQMALVRTMLEVVKSKPATASVPVVETSHKFFDLLTKVFGCIASVFSGTMFFLSWWRNRRETQQAAES